MPTPQDQLLADLRAVRKMLDHPSWWTQRAYARDPIGHQVMESHQTACCWCLSGAVLRVIHETPTPDGPFSGNRYYRVTDALFPNRELGQTMVAFNDMPNRTHQEVLELLDGAIKRLTG